MTGTSQNGGRLLVDCLLAQGVDKVGGWVGWDGRPTLFGKPSSEASLSSRFWVVNGLCVCGSFSAVVQELYRDLLRSLSTKMSCKADRCQTKVLT